MLCAAAVSALIWVAALMLIYSAFGQMQGEKPQTFAVGVLVGFIAAITAGLSRRAWVFWAVAVVSVGFGIWWWWTRIGSRPEIAAQIPAHLEVLFGAHFPLVVAGTLVIYLVLNRFGVAHKG